LKQVAENLQFESIKEFELTGNLYDICDSTYNRKGVYFFEIKNNEKLTDPSNWILNFTTLWKGVNFSWTPGIKKKRLNTHKTLSEWIPLYIGKSKKTGGRINEHIIQNASKNTFSMKLKARTNLYGQLFRVGWIPLEVENYDMIVPAIEILLRNKYNPIVGKQ
jgi:hypothetical protein